MALTRRAKLGSNPRTPLRPQAPHRDPNVLFYFTKNLPESPQRGCGLLIFYDNEQDRLMTSTANVDFPLESHLLLSNGRVPSRMRAPLFQRQLIVLGPLDRS